MTRDTTEITHVALGSNLGDRETTFSRVVRAIETDSAAELLGASPVFETEPVGPAGQGPYLNAVLKLRTVLPPVEWLDWLLALERALGRDRGPDAVRWGPRAIDLDILFYGDLRLETERLTLPHPRAHERAFVLIPMAALDPDFVHPALGASVARLAADLSDAERESVRAWPSPTNWPGIEGAARSV